MAPWNWTIRELVKSQEVAPIQGQPSIHMLTMLIENRTVDYMAMRSNYTRKSIYSFIEKYKRGEYDERIKSAGIRS